MTDRLKGMPKGKAVLVCPSCGKTEFCNGYKSFANGGVALDCVECGKRVMVTGAVDILVQGTTDLVAERVRHDESAVTRRAKLEGSLNDDKHVNIQLRVPRDQRERAKLAFAVAKVLNEMPKASAWPEQCFEAIVEDYIQGNEQVAASQGLSYEVTADGTYKIALPEQGGNDGG